MRWKVIYRGKLIKYSLNNSEITITTDSKSKTYKWSKFSYFWPVWAVQQGPAESTVDKRAINLLKSYKFKNTGQEVGESFALKPKGKIFSGVTIVSKGDNQSQVFNFLKSVLPLGYPTSKTFTRIKIGIFSLLGVSFLTFGIFSLFLKGETLASKVALALIFFIIAGLLIKWSYNLIKS